MTFSSDDLEIIEPGNALPEPYQRMRDFGIAESQRVARAAAQPAALSSDDLEIISTPELPKQPGKAKEPKAAEEATLTTSMSRGFGRLFQGLQAMGLQYGRRLLDTLDVLDRGDQPGGYDPIARQVAALKPEEREKLRSEAQRTVARSAAGVAREAQAIETLPRHQATERLTQAQGFDEVWEAFGSDPLAVIGHLGAESFPQMLPGLAGAAAAGPALGAAGGALALGAGSAAAEYAGTIIQTLQEAGVNVQDPKALERAVSDRELMERVRNKAMVRAGVVGAFDAASGGLASRTLAPARLAAKPGAREAVNLAAQMPAQGALGAMGEGAAALATGERASPGELAAEFLGEFAGAPAEVASMMATRRPAEAAPQPAPATDTAPVEAAEVLGQPESGPPAAGAPAPAEEAIRPVSAMQPRDRDRAASVAQMQAIANAPDFDRLATAPTPTDGAPLVSARGDQASGALLGSEATVTFDNGMKVPVQYAVVEADSVLASHSADGRPVQAYYAADQAPGTLRALNNGRTAGMQAAYALGTAVAYRERLLEAAPSLGLDPEQVNAYEKPLLVRLYPDRVNEEVPNLGELSNAGGGMRLGPVEQARADAMKLSSLAGLESNDEGVIDQRASAGFIRSFLAAVPQNEHNTLTDTAGNLSSVGLQRLRNAIFAKAFGAEAALDRVLESQDNNVRNITNGMMKAAPRVADMRARMEAGRLDRELDITEDFVTAVDEFSKLRAAGSSVAEYLAQGDMLGRPFSDEVIGLMGSIERMARSGRQVADWLNAYVEEVEQAGDPSQGTLLARPQLAAQDLLARVRPERAAVEVEYAQRAVAVAPTMEAAVAQASTLTDQTGAVHRARNVGGQWVVVPTEDTPHAKPLPAAPQADEGAQEPGPTAADQPQAAPGDPELAARPGEVVTVDEAAHEAATSPTTEPPHEDPPAFRAERAKPGVLREDEAPVEARLAEKLEADFEAAVEEYSRLKGTNGGTVLNTDETRELSRDYSESNMGRTLWANAVHEPASSFIKELYRRMLKRPAPAGKEELVVFTAGGTGAGKTSAIKSLPAMRDLTDKAHIVYDTNLNTFDAARKKIEQAIAANKSVVIMFVYREPVEALTGGMLPRAMKRGRVVVLREHHNTHQGVMEAIPRLMAAYKGDPRVKFFGIDNSRGLDRQAVVPIEELLEKGYNSSREELESVLEAERAAGRISDAIYRAARGEAPAAGGRGAGSDRSPDGRGDGQGPARDEAPERRELDVDARAYGARNRLVTPDEAEAARKILRDNLARLNAGLPVDLAEAALKLAVFHIEAGARTFAAFSKAMVEDLGEAIKPYLKGLYDQVRSSSGDLFGAMDGPGTTAVLEKVRVQPPKESKPRAEKAKATIAQVAQSALDFDAPASEAASEDKKPASPKRSREAVEYAGNKAASTPTGDTPHVQVAAAVQQRLENGLPITFPELQLLADKAFGKTMAAGGYVTKDAYDALELGINRFIAAHPEFSPANEKFPPSTILEGLQKRILDRIPTQTTRDERMDEFQQYSTPPTYAFLVNWLANVRKDETYLEPSAGVGGLAVFGKLAGANVVVNELDTARRAGLLRTLFASVFTENAEQLNNILPADVKPSVVVMNPPFSATGGRITGQRETMNGARHIEQALARLEPGGRLVAIVGDGMGPDRDAFRAWWRKIGERYNVRANVGIDGRGYRKYGTEFDNRILVIDKTGPTTGEIVTGTVDTVADAIPLLKGVRDDRPRSEQPAGKPSGKDAAGTSGRDPAATSALFDATGKPAAGAVRQPRGGARPAAQPAGESGGSPSRGRGPSDGGRAAGARAEEGGRGPVGELGAQGLPAGTDDRLAIAARAPRRVEAGEISEAVYEDYQPQRLVIERAHAHPAKLVQSAAMASTLPPVPVYQPNLPAGITGRSDGKGISIVGLEAVVYAGQAHAQFLPDGTRRGFFIGDGTGVGKGREIAGIFYDNWRSGRKKGVWITEKQGLFEDAKRDIADILWSPGVLFNQRNAKPGEALDRKEGVVFTTYSTLRSAEKPDSAKAERGEKTKTRVDQLVEWLGEDFDGVIAFDEAHNMANVLSTKGARGMTSASHQGLAGLELQKRLPKARVVYVSATGATEVRNLVYAQRLGLWGDGKPFRNAVEFVARIAAAGVSAMEVVARDMKAMGLYIARSLSFDGVTYDRIEHELTSAQEAIYNELARAWQTVLKNMNDALDVTGAGKNGLAKGAARSAFWGAHQRFFNQIITSMQMPSVIERVRADLDAGEAVVLQLVNTNEAAQERALAKQEEGQELEDLDLTPRDQLINYIQHSFPVAQYEEYEDEEGNIRSRPVVDSKGNPVVNREAVAMRDELIRNLKDIRVPDGPLEILLNNFGPGTVAEVTGRKRRVYRGVDDEGQPKTIAESRGRAAAQADAVAFMADKKRVLIFSDAGGTGFSFHADRTKKNQRHRQHYLVQPGWRADKAVQGLGRSHRTNEASQPNYRLVTTNLPAQKRFVSSIARRLDQLGALTRGQRQAASQGIFSEKDNLEGVYAARAVRQLFTDAYAGPVAGIDFSEFTAALGFDNLIEARTGKLNESKLPPVPQFLNRLLSLTTDMQERVFGEFISRMEAFIDVAAQNGELDTGVQTVRALKVHKRSDEVVYQDKESAAETRYVQLELTKKARIYTWDEAAKLEGEGDFEGYFQRKKTGTALAVYESHNETDDKGNVKKKYRIVTPTGVLYGMSERAFDREHAVKLDRAEAKRLWEKQAAEAPKTVTEKAHMLVGALLPIWDRLYIGDRAIQVVRTVTDDGDKLLGTVIPGTKLPAVLKNLGRNPFVDFTPAKVQEAVLAGSTAKLANGWIVKRSVVRDERRLEVAPAYGEPTRGMVNAIHSFGGFSEQIQWRDRLFIPTEGEALAKILVAHPLADLVDGKASRGGSIPMLGMRQVDVRAIVEPIAKKLSVPVHVVATPGDLPVAAAADTKGLYLSGRMYLVSDNLRGAWDVEATLAHELQHAGIDVVFGDNFNARDLALRNVVAKNEKLRELAQAWRVQYGEPFVRRRMAAGRSREQAERELITESNEEAVAYFAQRRLRFSGLRALVAVIAKALRARGFKVLPDWLEAATDAEALAFIADMRKAVEAPALHSVGTRTEPAFMVAFHGSPYDFDQFDITAIGRGEGAQAYGWGLYFAGKREVADYYKNHLGGRAVMKGDQGIDVSEMSGEVQAAVSEITNRHSMLKERTFTGMLEEARLYLSEVKSVSPAGPITEANRDWWEAVIDGLKELKKKGYRIAGAGKLYTVDLAPAEDEYLLWDAPMEKQPPKVKAALAKLLPEFTSRYYLGADKTGYTGPPRDGASFYDAIGYARASELPPGVRANPTGRDMMATAALREAGVRGIKYRDGASRNRAPQFIEEDSGSYNYVIFDDRDVSIMAKERRGDFIGSPEFRRWFKGSKVVEAGQPRVVYHATLDEFSVFERGHGTMEDIGFHFGETVDQALDIVTAPAARLRDLPEGWEKQFKARFDVGGPEVVKPGARILPVYLNITNPLEMEDTDNTYFPTGLNHDLGRMGVFSEKEMARVNAILDEDRKATGRQYRAITSRALALIRSLLEEKGYDGIVYRNKYEGKGGRAWVAFHPEQIKSAVGNVGTFDPENPDIRYARGDFAPPRRERRVGLLDAILKNAGGKWIAAHVTDPLWQRVTTLAARAIPERVKQGVVSDYGLPEPYLDARVDREARVNQLLRRSKGLLDRIQGLDRAQSRVAYLWMTAQPDLNTEGELMATLPEEARQALRAMKEEVAALGREARDLGLLSEDTYQRNNLAYLHRTYLKHERENQGAGATRKRSAAIRGEQFRGRGLRDDADMKALEAVDPEWWGVKAKEGEADVALKGKRFLRLERRGPAPGVEPLEGFEAAAPTGKLLEVVYWPLERGAPPAKYQAWRRDGEWEARFFDRRGKVGMWRDFTAEERARMGEIDEVRYAFARTMLAMVRDVETARFLKWTADEYSVPTPQQVQARGGTVVEAKDARTTLQTFAGEEWVRVPDGKAQGTGIPKYGALAGRFVPGAMWNDIRQMVNLQAQGELSRLWEALLTGWKISKTALSPAVHTNNVMSNMILADIADVRGRDIVRALSTLARAQAGNAEAKALLERYLDSGAERGSFTQVELKTEILEPLLKAFEEEESRVASEVGALARAAQIMSLALHGNLREAGAELKLSRTGRLAAAPFKKLIEIYGHEDRIFRLAKFVKEVEEGASDREAGKAARLAFLDYSINAPWIQAARRSALPFIAFSYRAIPLVVKAAVEKPWKIAKYALVAGGLNALAYAMLGDEGDEERERRLLPNEFQGKIFGIFPRMVRMPWNDETGAPIFLDVRRWIPVGDVMDTTGSHSVVPLPSWLSIGGPLAMLMEVFSNRAMFTGRPIVHDSDTLAEKVAKIADHQFKFWAPNLPIPNPLGYIGEAAFPDSPVRTGFLQTYATTNVARALGEETDAFGRVQNPVEAVMSSVGVKMKGYPADEMRERARRAAEREVREIDQVIGDLRRQRQMNGISQELFMRKVNAQIQKKRAVQARLAEKVGPP